MDRKKIIFILSLFFVPMIANATNGYFSHGTSLKERALAGAGVAFPQDAMAAATNPAGMAFMGNRFDVGAVLFKPEREYTAGSSLANGNGGAFTIGPSSENSADDNFLIPNFGINYQLTERDAIGLSIYGNGGLNTTYDGGNASFDPSGMAGAGVTFPGTFGGGDAGVDLIQVFFNFSYAHAFSDTFSVGISPIFAVQRFRSRGLNPFIPFTKTFANGGFPTNLTGNGEEYSYGGGVQVGALMKDVIGTADFGISYRSKMYMSEFDDYADLFAENGDFDIPSTLWAGFAVDVTESITLLADYQRIWYEDSDAVSNKIQNISNCSSPLIGGSDPESCLGGSNGAGFGWDNMDIIKLGVQWQARPNIIARIGYSHTDQPIDDDQVLFNILAPGVIENHLTLGATVDTQVGEFTFEAMHGFSKSVEGRNPFDPTQTIELEMKQFEVGVGWSKEF